MRRRDTPDAIPDIIRNQNGASPVDNHAHRATKGIAVFTQESGQELPRHPSRMSLFKGDEYDFVSTRGLSVPGTMQPDQGTALKTLRQSSSLNEREAEGGNVRAECVIRRNSLGDQIGSLWFYTFIDVLAVVTER